jgi:protein O-GlcNAc transferase
MTDIEGVRNLLEQGRYAESAARCERLLRARPMHAPAMELLGMARIGMGQLGEGVACLQYAAALEPDDASMLVRLGDVLMRCGEAARAAAAFSRALERSRPTPQLFYNLGAARQKAGDSAGAIESYRQCLRLDPGIVEAHNNLGTLLDEAGRYEEAIECFRQALEYRPGYLRALTNLGKVQRQAGRAAEAVATLESALAAAPSHAAALANLAAALLDLGRVEEALSAGRRAVAADPRLAETHFNLGRALCLRGDREAALASLREATTLKPELADAQALLGQELLQEGKCPEAIGHLERALAANQGLADAHVLLGCALFRVERPQDALTSFGRALEIDPRHMRAHLLSSWAHEMLNEYPEATASCEQAAALAPEDPEILSTLLNCSIRTFEWQRAAQILQRIRALPAGIEGINPFVLLGASDDPAEQLRASRGWGGRMLHARAPLPGLRSDEHPRIRIAYLSRDFYTHATSLLAAELFELHDRAAFEIVGVSYGPDDGSPIRARIAAACDEFLDVRLSSDREIARALREREIDIAVDLKGYTSWARTEILAYRPAPIQVNYLGYPGTMGVALVDYLIADPRVVPEEERLHYSESIVYLPDCYQVNDRQRPLADAVPRRCDVGLPEEAFVFCCFNNSWKITAPVFEVWMRLLQAVPGSVLWLLDAGPRGRERLQAEAHARGVAASRLVFCPRLSFAPHLARQRLADLFLDTTPVNAHTTASDALWIGLPVVTCAGRSFAARVGASLLHASGLAELVTGSLSEYEELALALARDRTRLAALRAHLERNRLSVPLFDTPAYCRHLESAYRRMCARQRAGAAPESFSIERDPG